MPEKFNQINKTDLVAMKQFIDQLGRYIETTQQILKDIETQHFNIGQEHAWVAPQYNQLTNVLEEMNTRIRKELEKLRAAQELTNRKYQSLCELYNVTF